MCKITKLATLDDTELASLTFAVAPLENMDFFLGFINKLSNLSPSLFRKKGDCMCVVEKLFKMPPILRWSSFASLAAA